MPRSAWIGVLVILLIAGCGGREEPQTTSSPSTSDSGKGAPDDDADRSDSGGACPCTTDSDCMHCEPGGPLACDTYSRQCYQPFQGPVIEGSP